MNKFVIMAALVAATAGLAVSAKAQEANGIDPVKVSSPASTSGDSASGADSTADSSASATASASAQATTKTTINVGGNPVVAQTEASKPQNVYNDYTKKVIVNKPTRTIRLTRVVNGRARVVHLYRPVNQRQAKQAAIAALRQLNVVDKVQLNTALAHLANDKIFRSLYRDWGIASKSFVDARIAAALKPINSRLDTVSNTADQALGTAQTADQKADSAYDLAQVNKESIKNNRMSAAMGIFGCLVVIVLVVIGGIFSRR